MFTLNNYTPEDVVRLSGLLDEESQVKYLIFGKEVAPETGTPHLQGFVIFGRPFRFRRVKALISDRAYVANARGTSEQCRDYCKKEGDFEEFGEFPDKQGKRSDLDDVLQWSDEFTADKGRPPAPRDFALNFPQQYIKYNVKLDLVAELRAPPVLIREGECRPWQQRLEETLQQDADDRKVMFYVDVTGGTGKSWFQGYYVSKYPMECQLLGVGKRDDIAYAVDPEKSCFFFNVPRNAMQYLQYTIFEQLKDKVLFSTKYHSKTKILRKHPHVVVFCNEWPDETAMSADRYEIIDMSGL